MFEKWMLRMRALPMWWRAAVCCLFAAVVHAAERPPGMEPTVVLSIEGRVEVLRKGDAGWAPAGTNAVLQVGDQVRTGFRSRATLRLSDLSLLRMNQLTTLQFQEPAAGRKRPVLDLKSGSTFFLGREKPSDLEFRTPQASGAILGTEFLLVATAGRTELTLLDGEVRLANEAGQLPVVAGERAEVVGSEAPRKTAVLQARSLLQWLLYYPAVLDPQDPAFAGLGTRELADSLAAYRIGDLRTALDRYPTDRKPVSDVEKVYLAGLVLAVGQVDEATALLQSVGSDAPAGRMARAVRLLMEAVRGDEGDVRTADLDAGATASEFLAASYLAQARFDLPEALRLARKAVDLSPAFGFGWARVAELEFSFGRTSAARAALESALRSTPRNAQAVALRGFLAAAQNRVVEAEKAFDEAIAIDPALGHGWLGRGLTRIRQGRSGEGRADLQVAATVEPQRALLRSYLGKAFSNERDVRRAAHEIELAKKLDPNDPTAWLYSALVAGQGNEINRAVRELETAAELNDNRRVFRSRLLLDEDRAVTGANLASIYRDAGMLDWGRREASLAVDADYLNHSAHRFLAQTYDAMRDPNQVDLRYETAWLSEMLMANLLAPVGAGPLSRHLSQQEYSPLLERDRLGLTSTTEYLSRGEWHQYGSQYGTFGNTAYALDAEYHSLPGQAANADREEVTFDARFKQQFGPRDSLLVETIYTDIEAGDAARYYDPNMASRTFRMAERQEPNVLAGWHHEWTPGSHTVALIGRLHDDFSYTDPAATALTLQKNAAGEITRVIPRGFDTRFGSELEAFTSELQHLQRIGSHTLVLGGRAQVGELEGEASMELARGGFPGPDVYPPLDQTTSHDLRRFSLYAYDHWQLLDSLRLTAGLAYEHLDYPRNSELPPLDDQQESNDLVAPKLGLEWTPVREVTLRAAYSRSLGGMSYDQSVRLEPTQMAGFNQAYRSLIPESVAGLVPGTEFETIGTAVDLRFKTRTYVSLYGEWLGSEGDRGVGVFERAAGVLQATPGTQIQRLDFRERTVGIIANQLLGEEWSVGAGYRLSQADLEDDFLGVPATAQGAFGFEPHRDLTAVLHQVDLYARYFHRCGFFGELRGLWVTQSNQGYTPDLPGDDVWQLNAWIGYRFRQRLAEIRLGVLNLTDQDYRLNPLNLMRELPRERTFAASLRFNF